MYKHLFIFGIIFLVLILTGCSENSQITSAESNQNDDTGIPALAKKGAIVVNGWYEEEEIYYINGGREEGVTERGENQIYLIGGERMYQAQVVLHIPGEPGYSPHWNVNVVNTANGYTIQDIINAGYAAVNYHISGGENLLFDDAADILAAEAAGLITIAHPGIVVLCPIVPEAVANAPGNTRLPEDEFPPFPSEF